ncbi:MAG: hypothetical protein R2874_07715, partial [Desulfobacterales bacterium]
PPPDIVMISLAGDPRPDDRLIHALQEAFTDAETVFLAPEPELKICISRLKNHSREFIPLPPDPDVLELCLDRVVEKISLRKKIHQLEYALGNYPDGDTFQLLETERFLMVKQVIDKLSSFIARIARDVEDGVKYFHSTPYFVSIHTCDLKIIANDESFQKYFGNKVGKNSWDIYRGQTATPDGCPVGRTIRTAMVQHHGNSEIRQQHYICPVVRLHRPYLQ